MKNTLKFRINNNEFIDVKSIVIDGVESNVIDDVKLKGNGVKELAIKGKSKKLTIRGDFKEARINAVDLSLDEIIIENVNAKEINFENVSFKEITIDGLKCSKFDFSNKNKESKLTLKNHIDVEEYFSITKVKFKKISMMGPTLSGRIEIAFQTCKKLIINDIILKDELILSCYEHITNVSLTKFSCQGGKIIFHDFKPTPNTESKVYFQKLSLGESEFIGCNFEDFKEFHIEKLQFQKATSYETKWPRNTLPRKNDEAFNHETLINYYYKVKEMHLNEGEKEEQYKFHKLENDERLAALDKGSNQAVLAIFVIWLIFIIISTQNMPITQTTPFIPISILFITYLSSPIFVILILLNVIELNKFGDWISLWFSKISSKHGTCWTRALSILLIFNFLLIPFISYFICAQFSLKDAITFMNPVHKISDITKTDNNLFYIIDTVGRAFNGYIYFQIVKSFRKYVT